jgi:ribosome maturation factor RimP
MSQEEREASKGAARKDVESTKKRAKDAAPSFRSGRISPEHEAEFAAIADHAGCELVHVELKGSVLQLILDREEGGISLTDCEHVSKLVSAWLDVVDFGRNRYVLEVSSPGLDRQLYRRRDYQRFVGSLVRVTFSSPEIRKRTLVARLLAFDPAGPGEITVAEEKTGESLRIPLDQIQKARLEIEL